MRICENCGIEHDGSYGSGRFCSSTCARGFATKNKRDEINTKVSSTLKQNSIGELLNDKAREFLENHDTYKLDINNPLQCSVCGKTFNSYASLRQHIRVHEAEYVASRKQLKVRAFTPGQGDVDLDITNEQLDEYRKVVTTCEICGREFSHMQTVNGEKRKMSLCVDHDHKTNKFRGLLCVLCNRSLEWSLRYEDKIDKYLRK